MREASFVEERSAVAQINRDFKFKSFGGKLWHKLFFFVPFLLTNSSAKSPTSPMKINISEWGSYIYSLLSDCFFVFRRILSNRNADGRFELTVILPRRA